MDDDEKVREEMVEFKEYLLECVETYTKHKKGNEFYLFLNGNLIYKRWIKEHCSLIFDVMAYSKQTLKSYREN